MHINKDLSLLWEIRLISTLATDDALTKRLNGDIDRVENWVITASLNGMFRRITGGIATRDSIRQCLEDARNYLEDEDYPSCQANITNAACLFSDALNSTKWTWRMANIYGGYMWIYLTLFLLSCVFAIYYFRLDAILLNVFGIHETDPSFTIYYNGILAVTWGAIGGIGRGIWFLKENVNDLGFRNSWIGWFLSCPFIGGFFGAVVYFILIAGLVSVTLEGVDFKNSLAIIAISVVAGFSWPAALEMIKRVVNSFAGVAADEKG